MTGILDWSQHRHGSWFHCSVDTVKRSAGRSSVAAAAYVTGKALHQEGREEPHDYTRRQGVLTSFTMAPEHAPEWVFDPESLWNAAETAERRVNSVVARKADIALPHVVDPEEREAIAQDIGAELVRRYGVAVTVAVHEPDRHGDQRNDHAHFLWTTREITEDGLGKKTRILDDVRTTGPLEIASFREYVADRINQSLSEAGSDERVTAQSYAVEGIDRVATTHLGPAASGLERRGIESSRGDWNRQARQHNSRLDELVEEYAQAEAEIVATLERTLDDRYGELEHEEIESLEQLRTSPTDIAPPADTASAPVSGGQDDQLARSIEEEQAALDADAAPFEAHLKQDEDIPQYGVGTTWWERWTNYGHELVQRGVERARGLWQRYIESRRGPEQSSPEADEREL